MLTSVMRTSNEMIVEDRGRVLRQESPQPLVSCHVLLHNGLAVGDVVLGLSAQLKRYNCTSLLLSTFLMTFVANTSLVDHTGRHYFKKSPSHLI